MAVLLSQGVDIPEICYRKVTYMSEKTPICLFARLWLLVSKFLWLFLEHNQGNLRDRTMVIAVTSRNWGASDVD